MTKQATLGPIDPSVNTPLNPQVPGAPPNVRVPVSVEAIRGFMDFAKSEKVSKKDVCEIIAELSTQVHPHVLGEAYRARSQIRMLARKLLSRQITDEKRIEKILGFLCSESGSHDYTINHREARNELGFNVQTPDESLYRLIKDIYDDFAEELQLTRPFDPNLTLGTNSQMDYSFHRALIESVEGGGHVFVSEGQLRRQTIQTQQGVSQEAIHDSRSFEGWRYETA